MNGLQIVSDMTPIEIALQIDENGMTTARKLYEFLGLNPSNYSKWCRTNITQNEFATENEDYFYSSSSTSEQGRGNFAQDFKLTAHFAKKLSMKGSGERAEQAREYFAKVEERAKAFTINRQQLSPQMQMILGMADSMARQELEQKRQAEHLKRLEKKQEEISETFSKKNETDEEFQSWVKRCIGKIAESDKFVSGYTGTRTECYRRAWIESYERLNQKRPHRLSQRLINAREQAISRGMTQSYANSINKLSIICGDKNLKPIYEVVIKEMMIFYRVNA